MNKLFVALVLVVCVSYVNGLGEGFGAELANLDFRNLFGGPMMAVVQAQALSSKTTTDFITNVGFIKEGSDFKVRTVSFEYSKQENGTGRNFTLTVPFILLMPIPYIEINVLSIDLNVKLSSSESRESEQTLNVYAEVGAEAKWFAGSVNFKGGFSYKSNNKQTGTVNKEYALDIHVQCGQAALPKGTERILDLLEGVILDAKN